MPCCKDDISCSRFICKRRRRSFPRALLRTLWAHHFVESAVEVNHFQFLQNLHCRLAHTERERAFSVPSLPLRLAQLVPFSQKQPNKPFCRESFSEQRTPASSSRASFDSRDCREALLGSRLQRSSVRPSVHLVPSAS